MKHTTRRTVAAVGTLVAGLSLLGAPPAQSDDIAPSRITVRSSDDDVASGEQFVLRGAVWSEGERVPGAVVKVRTYRDGAWVRVKGAVVTTNDEGRYRVRVMLAMKGERMLRVVGNPAGDDIAIARKDLVVTVH